VFVPVGKPVTVMSGMRRNPVDPVPLRDYAQIIVGLGMGFDKDNKPRHSVVSFTEKNGTEINAMSAQEFILSMRGSQWSSKGRFPQGTAGLTAISQQGIFEGVSENSLEVVIVREEDKTGETFADFEFNMVCLVQDLTNSLGQSEVWLTLYQAGQPYKAFRATHD
jgi:hypothetical protein